MFNPILLVYTGNIGISILIFAILTLTVNLQYGSAGIFNLGVVAFFMIGAYASSYITLAGFPFLVGVICGSLLSAAVGYAISLPALNLRGDFLALATFMFASIVDIIVLNVPQLGGAVGIAHVPSAFPWIEDYNVSVLANLILAALLFGVVYLFYKLLMLSPYGRVLKSVKDNEVLAEALGKDTFRYKSEIFTYSVTFTVYIMSIIGGSSTGIGALLGAAIYTIVQAILVDLKDVVGILSIDPNNLTFILFGLVTVLLLYFKPEGIVRSRLRKVDDPKSHLQQS